MSSRRLIALSACILTVLTGAHPVSAARTRLAAGAPVPATTAPATSAPAAAQLGTDDLPETAKAQIASLLAEKESRTPVQQKIDSNLLYAVKQSRGEPVSDVVPTIETGISSESGDGRVVVDIVAHVGGTLYEQIVEGGGEVQYVYAEYNSLRALVRIDQIESIAANEDVIFVGPEQKSMTQNAPAPAGVAPTEGRSGIGMGFAERAERVRASVAAALPRVEESADKLSVGSQNSQGDTTHQANLARSMRLSDGAGVKIGVLSNGVTNLAASQALGDLGPVTVLPGQTGTGDEGTAMLEIIHDLAPKAKLFFATANPTIAAFASNIRDLRRAGCDIIVDDVFYFVETPFQDGQTTSIVSNTNGGIVTQAVKDVTANGALYFSSAGNQGNKDDNTSSCYQGDFVDGGTLAGANGGTVHNFGGGAQSNLIQTGPGGGSNTPPINLYWADPLGASTNDYDLFVFNNALTAVVASSTNVQNGTQDPFEQAPGSSNVTNNRVVVLKKTGAANRFFHITINANGQGRLGTSTEGTTKGHSMAQAAYSVAATPATSPGPFPSAFSASNVTETFSSDGPRRIFFNGNGAPFTPGDFSSTGGTLRQKPDITAADGVAVTGVGGFPTPFYGTSAAAPHAAAIAGLIFSADPNTPPAQIRSVLTSTAIDIEGVGVDRNTGAGIVMPVPALQANGASSGPLFDVGTITTTEVGGDGNGFVEPGESATINVQLTNAGDPATAISTTLIQFTPGVALTSGSSAYPDISTGGSATNTTPFAFTLNTNVACDVTIQFALFIDYAGGAQRVVQFDLTLGRPPLSITSTIDATAPAASSEYTATTGTQTNRLTRDGRASTVTLPKTACPGITTVATNPRYDAYTFATCATGPANRTITVRLSTPCPTVTNGTQLFSAAYTGSYVPSAICTNYLADSGSSPGANGTVSYTFSVPAGGTFVLVVSEVPGTATNCSYTLSVSGLCNVCPPPTPTVAFSSIEYFANENAGTANLLLTRSGDTTAPSTVSVTDLGGDATPGDDYTFTSPTLVTFAVGETSKMVPVGVLDDAVYEPEDEVVSFRVTSVANVAIGSPSITNLTIVDDEPDPVVEFGSATFSANETAGTGTLTLTRTGDTTLFSAVTVIVGGGTATPDQDFQNSFPRNAFFDPGETTTTVEFPVFDDTVYEPGPNETILFSVAALSHSTIGAQNTATFEIVDNDSPPPVVAFGAATYSASEGVGTATVTLTRTGSTAALSQVTVTRTGGTATPDGDFQNTFPRLVTFDVGSTSQTVEFSILDDLLYEPGPNETIEFTLSTPVGATIGVQAVTTFSIVENDSAATVVFDSATYTANEFDGTRNLVLTRSGAVAGSSTVSVSVTGGTAMAGSDYEFTSPTTVTFGPSELSKVVSVTIDNDSIYEPGPNETVVFTVTSVSDAAIGTQSTTTLGIVDNDPPPTVVFGSATFSVTEAGAANLSLTRTGDTSGSSTVAVSVTGGTATGGSDYNFTSPTNITFGPGEVSKTFAVTILDDNVYEPGLDETVMLSVANVSGATIGATSATTLSIIDNDSQPTVTLAGGGTVNENAGNVVLTATLSNPTTQTVTVALAFNGTAMIGAGNDYTASSMQIVIPASSTSGTVTLAINDDAAPESDETIVVDVSSVTNATESGTQQQTVTIADNDCAISCPANITLSASPGICGTVVNYAAPTTSGPCGAVTCVPASGSFFAVGVTTVTCTSAAGPSCSFTVTVNDVQAPTVFCPSNMTAVATSSAGATVTYTTPGAFDFCSTPTVTCVPASGSLFAVGATTVTCTATDASSNSASCTFDVNVLQHDTVAIYVPATNGWFLRNTNSPGPADVVFGYGGISSWIAIKGDWNNDGVDTPGLYDPATGNFFLKNSTAGGLADITFSFGASNGGFVPIAGDWNNDGTDSVGLYNPTTGVFFLKNVNASGTADVMFTFGGGGGTYIPVAGDWDGAGGDSIGLYNTATGVFFLKNANSAGVADFAFQFGQAAAGTSPLVGDWNNNGVDTVGIYNASTGAFFLTDASPSGAADYTFFYGPPNSRPLAGNWDGQ